MRLRSPAGFVLLLVVPLLAACSEDVAGPVTGDVIPARHDDQFEDGKKASVTVPVGRLMIRAEEPVDGAASEDTRELTAVDAPAGATLVPITWQYDPWSSGRFDDYLNTSALPQVDLVTDGQSYRLPAPDMQDEQGESFYVVVDGAAEERVLEVEFDGVTQTVDLVTGDRDPGRARGLYRVDDSRLRQKSCENPSWFDETNAVAQFTCDLTGPVLLPYADGEWAAPGHMWLAVTLDTQLRAYSVAGPEGSGAHYAGSKVKTDARIEDKKPVSERSSGGDDDVCPVVSSSCNYRKHLIFDVTDDEPGPLVVEQTYRLGLGARWGDWNPDAQRTTVGRSTLKLWNKKNRD